MADGARVLLREKMMMKVTVSVLFQWSPVRLGFIRPDFYNGTHNLGTSVKFLESGGVDLGLKIPIYP